VVSEKYRLRLSEDKEIEIGYIENPDWEGLSDPCPECEGAEFNHIEYSGGHYGLYQGAVIERTDYWDQKGSLYTECLDCGEILYKNPAFDLLRAYLDGELNTD
jgi:hypothetical protein